jgi:adenylate cyclase
VIARDGDYVGRTVNVAARVAAQAGPGVVLATDEARIAVGDAALRFQSLGPTLLKGLAAPVELFRVIAGP